LYDGFSAGPMYVHERLERRCGGGGGHLDVPEFIVRALVGPLEVVKEAPALLQLDYLLELSQQVTIGPQTQLWHRPAPAQEGASGSSPV